jgi:hypothetical protein
MMKATCKSKVMAKQGKAMQGREGVHPSFFLFFPPFDFFSKAKTYLDWMIWRNNE